MYPGRQGLVHLKSISMAHFTRCRRASSQQCYFRTWLPNFSPAASPLVLDGDSRTMRRLVFRKQRSARGILAHQFFDNLADDVACQDMTLLNSWRFLGRNAN